MYRVGEEKQSCQGHMQPGPRELASIIAPSENRFWKISFWGQISLFCEKTVHFCEFLERFWFQVSENFLILEGKSDRRQCLLSLKDFEVESKPDSSFEISLPASDDRRVWSGSKHGGRYEGISLGPSTLVNWVKFWPWNTCFWDLARVNPWARDSSWFAFKISFAVTFNISVTASNVGNTIYFPNA